MNMKKLLAHVLVATSLTMATGYQNVVADTNSIVKDQVNWELFLARHDLTWESLPEEWHHGAFLGNGLMGAVIYKEDDRKIRWDVGRSDVTSHRRDNCRLPIGQFYLETVGKIQSGIMHQDLWNAEITATVKTDRGELKIRSLTPSDETVITVNVEATGDEKNCRFYFLPQHAVDFRNVVCKRLPAEERAKDKPNPQPTLEKIADGEIALQKRIGGGEYSTAWREVRHGDKRLVYLTVADVYPSGDAKKRALKTLDEITKKSYAEVIKNHRNWWHKYYPKSFVSIPDTRMESFYWIQIHKLACATRSDGMPMDLLGPWYVDTFWPRIWWNLNVQIAYSPVYTANHLELGESFSKMIDRNRKNFEKNAKDIYGINNGATVAHTACYDGLRGDGSAAAAHYINPADFTWGLFNYWQQYKYSMNSELVTDQKKHAFYDMLRKSVNIYLHEMKMGSDGQYHLPVWMSPEYSKVADNNYNLSMMRWACKTLLDLNERYQLNDSLASRWQDALDKLVEYQVDETGYMVGKEMPMKKSHRHWAHLQMLFPLCQVDLDNQKERALAEKSIKHWLAVDRSRQIFGWSGAAASCLYSQLGDGDKALSYLLNHHSQKRFVMPNTMYVEGKPVVECALFAAKSLQDMQLQSHAGKIRVFPAIPAKWQDTVFHNLRAEGAFLVSAERKGGETNWVRIKSLAGEKCVLKAAFGGDLKQKGNRQFLVTKTAENTYEIDLKKGEEIVLFSRMEHEFTIKPLKAEPGRSNFYGLPDRRK